MTFCFEGCAFLHPGIEETTQTLGGRKKIDFLGKIFPKL